MTIIQKRKEQYAANSVASLNNLRRDKSDESVSELKKIVTLMQKSLVDFQVANATSFAALEEQNKTLFASVAALSNNDKLDYQISEISKLGNNLQKMNQEHAATNLKHYESITRALASNKEFHSFELNSHTNTALDVNCQLAAALKTMKRDNAQTTTKLISQLNDHSALFSEFSALNNLTKSLNEELAINIRQNFASLESKVFATKVDLLLTLENSKADENQVKNDLQTIISLCTSLPEIVSSIQDSINSRLADMQTELLKCENIKFAEIANSIVDIHTSMIKHYNHRAITSCCQIGASKRYKFKASQTVHFLTASKRAFYTVQYSDPPVILAIDKLKAENLQSIVLRKAKGKGLGIAFAAAINRILVSTSNGELWSVSEDGVEQKQIILENNPGGEAYSISVEGSLCLIAFYTAYKVCLYDLNDHFTEWVSTRSPLTSVCKTEKGYAATSTSTSTLHYYDDEWNEVRRTPLPDMVWSIKTIPFGDCIATTCAAVWLLGNTESESSTIVAESIEFVRGDGRDIHDVLLDDNNMFFLFENGDMIKYSVFLQAETDEFKNYKK